MVNPVLQWNHPGVNELIPRYLYKNKHNPILDQCKSTNICLCHISTNIISLLCKILCLPYSNWMKTKQKLYVSLLTLKLLEMHRRILSTVATDALEPNHQAISNHSVGKMLILWTSYKNIAFILYSVRKWNYILEKNWPSCLMVNGSMKSFPGRHFKNTYELLNLRALKFSPVNKIDTFPCMG